MPIIRCSPHLVLTVLAEHPGAGRAGYVTAKNGAELGPLEFAALQRNPYARRLLDTGDLKAEQSLEEVIEREFAPSRRAGLVSLLEPFEEDEDTEELDHDEEDE